MIPPMLTKFFIEDDARALFREVGSALSRSEQQPNDFKFTSLWSQEKVWYREEIEKLDDEVLQVGLAFSEQETGGCQEPAEAVPSPTTFDEWTKVTLGILADMPRQNILGHTQPCLWGPSERLARGCEVNEKDK